MPTAGTVIAKKYELARLLGQGSMGDVWLARHLALGEHVALKLLTSAPSDNPEEPSIVAARFRFEAQVAARLSRKTRHIVRVTDQGEEDGFAYLVMELLEGETLEQRLSRAGAMTLGDATKVVTQIARALTEAHGADVIHRDLKPANIFLASDEDGDLLVKLLDFGIARAIHTLRVPGAFATGSGFVFGTPGYMSPEQVNPACKLDRRCDLWALATVAYETLTGRLPIVASSGHEYFSQLCEGRFVPVHEWDPTLPAGLAAFFACAFAKALEARYTSAAELAHAFDQSLAKPREEPVARPPSPGTLRGQTLPIASPVRWRPRRAAGLSSAGPRWRGPWRARWALVVPVAVLLAVGSGASAWRLRTPRALPSVVAGHSAGSLPAAPVDPVTELPHSSLTPLDVTAIDAGAVLDVAKPPGSTEAAVQRNASTGRPSAMPIHSLVPLGIPAVVPSRAPEAPAVSVPPASPINGPKNAPPNKPVDKSNVF